jgi:succinate-semialdehyde dehydrogenase/glutarate-semialdehyde dehydrogenase
MQTIQTINPASGQPLKTYTQLSDNGIDATVDATYKAFLDWRVRSKNECREKLHNLARCLQDKKDRLGKLITQEMGKPIVEARAEIEKCAWVCNYYADCANEILADEHLLSSGNEKGYAVFQPLGIVLAVMPWNFPFWQVFRFAAPAVAAGNACVLKHAGNVSGCALEIERLFQTALFPENLFSTLLINHASVEQVIKHDKVRAVTLTGSTNAGRTVAAVAGRALKKTVLELGGSDPYLILEDADIEAAAKTCAASRLINSGQSCIGAKRFIVVDAARERFEQAFVDCMKNAKTGDPLDEKTKIGPLARRDLRDQLHQQVIDSINQGARCLTGGMLPEGPGFYYPPTVLTDVDAGMPAFREELFGPVAAIIPVENEQAAIRVANDSQYGLGSAVFTADTDRGEQIARQLEAGCCFINDFVRSDPRLPFGGIKNSGYGRELSHYGIKEFVNIKTIFVKASR